MGQPRNVQDTTGRQAKSSEVTPAMEAEDKTSVARPRHRESHIHEWREKRRLGGPEELGHRRGGEKEREGKREAGRDDVDAAGGKLGRKGVVSYVKQDVSLSAQRSPAA